MQTVRFSVQSSELGLLTLSPAYEYCSFPPLGPGGEAHSLAGQGMVGPNSDEGTDTLVLCVYYKLLYIYCFPAGNFSITKGSRNFIH
jgi:hypothetical protein